LITKGLQVEVKRKKVVAVNPCGTRVSEFCEGLFIIKKGGEN